MSVWAKNKNWLSLDRKEQTKQHVLSIQNKDMQINTFLSLFKLKSVSYRKHRRKQPTHSIKTAKKQFDHFIPNNSQMTPSSLVTTLGVPRGYFRLFYFSQFSKSIFETYEFVQVFE